MEQNKSIVDHQSRPLEQGMPVEGVEQEPESQPDVQSEFISDNGKIYAIGLTVIFIVSGIAFALHAFPELSLIRGTVAGICFGGFLALCSISYSAL